MCIFICLYFHNYIKTNCLLVVTSYLRELLGWNKSRILRVPNDRNTDGVVWSIVIFRNTFALGVKRDVRLTTINDAPFSIAIKNSTTKGSNVGGETSKILSCCVISRIELPIYIDLNKLLTFMYIPTIVL